MRIILSSFIALHGIIHLVGFVREWNLRPIGAHSGKTLIHLSNATAKFAGLLWLFACLLILAATVGYYSRKDWFWGIGIVAIALSQFSSWFIGRMQSGEPYRMSSFRSLSSLLRDVLAIIRWLGQKLTTYNHRPRLASLSLLKKKCLYSLG
jgi:hypothetical protein